VPSAAPGTGYHGFVGRSIPVGIIPKYKSASFNN
jgi:hypothetical protein